MKLETIKKYPYIWAWGKSLGSFDYYIEMQIAKAVAEQAPWDACYKASEGSTCFNKEQPWVCLEHIGNPALRRRLAVRLMGIGIDATKLPYD